MSKIIKEIAAALNGVDYKDKATAIRAQCHTPEARAAGVVVAYPESDDLLEFAGYIDAELSAYGGVKTFLDEKGLIQNRCDNEDCPYHAARQQDAKYWIELSDACDGPAWTISTNIPEQKAVKFSITEDGEAWGEGLVFCL